MQTILTTTGINVANLPLSSRGQTTLLACHDLGKALKESFHLTSILWLKKRQNKTKQNKTKQNKTKTKDERTNEQVDSGLLWSELLSTTIFFLTVNSTLDQFLLPLEDQRYKKSSKVDNQISNLPC